MTIANVTLNNTFDEWRTVTNQVITFVNEVDSQQLINAASNTAVLTVTPNKISRNQTLYITLNVSSDVLDTSTLNVATANAVNVVFAGLANTDARLVLVSDDANTINSVTNAAIIQANVARTHANAAFLAANNFASSVGSAANSYSRTVGTAGNTYAETVGTAGNNYTRTVGTAGNTYSENVGTAGNNYTITVGAAGNTFTIQSFNQANTARVQANDAFTQANLAFELASFASGNNANTLISNKAAFDHANSAFEQANTARIHANTAHETANSGFLQANTARIHANTAHASANAGLLQANTARIHANVSFEQSNTARTHANTAHASANAGQSTANASYAFANSAHAIANLAFTHANNAYAVANTANNTAVGNTIANGMYQTRSTRSQINFIETNQIIYNIVDDAAGDRVNVSVNIIGINPVAVTANAAFLHANAGFDQANTARIHANTAHASANSGFDQANTARVHANTAHASANAGLLQANTARDHANAAHATANAGLLQANTARIHANTAHASANSGFDQANTARTHANTAHATANAGFDQANTARIHANAAFLAANNVAPQIAPTFVQANTARDHANTAHASANAGLLQANTARDHANAAFLAANNVAPQIAPTFVQANTARVHANTAHASANAGLLQANTARNVANSAFERANTGFSNTSGSSFVGNLQIPTGNLTIGDGTTQGVRLHVNSWIGVANVWPQAEIMGGSQFIQFNANTNFGGWNDLMFNRDISIIYSRGGSDDSANLVIGPWTDSSFGYKQDGAGRHGFNTRNPRHALDANGTANISSTLTVGANIIVRGTSITINGLEVIQNTANQTMTNKRIRSRVASTSTNSATPTLNTDNTDHFIITGQTVNITSMTSNLSGTPTDGQKLIVSMTAGSGTPTVAWGASFESSGSVTLPSSISTTRLDIGFLWNAATSKWRCVAAI